MKTITLMSALILSTSSCFAADWITLERKELAGDILLGIDTLQTIYISNHCDTVHENNVFLGTCPSKKRVLAYFGGVFITKKILEATLPDQYRHYLANTILTVQIGAVGKNISLGIGMEW